MIDAARLQPYLHDHREVTGRETDQFVCPILLKPFELSHLIEGHILNEAFNKAAQRTIVQYGKVDHFYGSVEAQLVAHLNSKDKSRLDMLDEAAEIEIQFADGSSASAFLAGRPSADKAAGQFPKVPVEIDGSERWLYVRTPVDNPMLQQPWHVLVRSQWMMPAHWVAAMLKAGYLTMFDMLGYTAVYDPFSDTLRRTLKEFYLSKQQKRASEFFNDFRKATKFAFTADNPEDALATRRQLPWDSIERRHLLFHFTPSRTLFGVTCVFQINDVSATVTMPSTLGGGDVATAWGYYQRLMDEDPTLPQHTHLGQYKDGKMQVEERTINAGMIDDATVRALLLKRRGGEG